MSLNLELEINKYSPTAPSCKMKTHTHTPKKK